MDSGTHICGCNCCMFAEMAALDVCYYTTAIDTSGKQKETIRQCFARMIKCHDRKCSNTTFSPSDPYLSCGSRSMHHLSLITEELL